MENTRPYKKAGRSHSLAKPNSTDNEKEKHIAFTCSTSNKLNIFLFIANTIGKESQICHNYHNSRDGVIEIRFQDRDQTASIWTFFRYLNTLASQKPDLINFMKNRETMKKENGICLSRTARGWDQSGKFVLISSQIYMDAWGHNYTWHIPAEILKLIGYNPASNTSFIECVRNVVNKEGYKMRDLEITMPFALAQDFVLSVTSRLSFAMEDFGLRDYVISEFLQDPLRKKRIFRGIWYLTRDQKHLLKRLEEKDPKIFGDIENQILEFDITEYNPQNPLFEVFPTVKPKEKSKISRKTNQNKDPTPENQVQSNQIPPNSLPIEWSLKPIVTKDTKTRSESIQISQNIPKKKRGRPRKIKSEKENVVNIDLTQDAVHKQNHADQSDETPTSVRCKFFGI